MYDPKWYIRNTSDFLWKLKSLSTIPSSSILVTMDANSIYTNIDPEEGVDDCYRKLKTHTKKNCFIKHFEELHSINSKI